ncbi:MAG: exodeoxyribonuclease VII small subunit [Gammaproteobacteria bacterium]
MATSAKKPDKKIDFEANIAALQELVEKMERGDFTLEESVAQFEKGMALAKSCQEALRSAEMKVSKLVKTIDGQQALAPMEQPQDD